jgi:ubiquinone/menaquinone biosynthesis C-methylase UbiE
MPAPVHESQNRAYYDAFSARYEAQRGTRSDGGYHDLLDELEAEFVRRFGAGRDVLEVGCGTGLVLERIRRFARSAQGVDLSPGMLEHARARGLEVQLGSASALPFADASFDVSCAFKVLAHVQPIASALSEMARVVRPGGHVLAEFYNPWSLRALLKRLTPAGKVAPGLRESQVFTRYDSPRDVQALIPAGCRLISSRGIRIVTPSAHLMSLPALKQLLRLAERRLCDSPLARFGGFWIAALEKQR